MFTLLPFGPAFSARLYICKFTHYFDTVNTSPAENGVYLRVFSEWINSFRPDVNFFPPCNKTISVALKYISKALKYISKAWK